MKRLLPSTAACLVALALQAQGPVDTVLLRTFDVVAPRMTATPGAKLQLLDSATLERHRFTDLGRLLTEETPVFVKNYGPGSLATTSFRGGSASHTAVLWNGFQLNSPMNGQLDLALLPVGIANQVAVQYGSSTALWGSGAVGGAILLNHLPRFNTGTRGTVGLAVGSFGERRHHVQVEQGGRYHAIALGAYHNTAENDFPLSRTGLDDAGDRRQANAAFAQRGLHGDAHVRLNARQRIGVHAWYQGTERSIPPTLGQPLSTAQQQDESLRLAADWQRSGARATTTARVGWSDEALDWYATAEAEASRSSSRTLIAEGETRLRIGQRHQLHTGVNITHARAVADGYQDGRTQERQALFAAHRYGSADGRFRASAAARQELLDGRAVPFTGSIGAEYDALPWLGVKGQVAKVYRVPTLNDLYWRPGGNPDLRAESGHSRDLGAVLHIAHKGITLRSELTWFDRLIDDWIQWTPGPAFWSPRNILQVWSRGVESHSALDLHVREVDVTIGVITSHVVSTNLVATGPNDASVDKQLIYVPMYSGHGRLGLRYRQLAFTGQMSHTGVRYTSSDNRQFLAPYWLANAWLSYALPPWKGCTLRMQAQCNNLFDTEYQVMQDRPMPLRSFQLGIDLSFHRPHTTTP